MTHLLEAGVIFLGIGKQGILVILLHLKIDDLIEQW